jgi:hypothetical protein
MYLKYIGRGDVTFIYLTGGRKQWRTAVNKMESPRDGLDALEKRKSLTLTTYCM